MFTNTKAVVVIISCALVAQAQSSTTLTAPPSHTSAVGVDTCILDCATAAAASAGCAGYADLSCVCSSSAFQDASSSCLQANCTADDIATAEQLQNQRCGTLSTGSGPSVSHASTKASSGPSSTSASATQPATSSSAAMALSAPFSLGSLVGTLVASAGALVGAAFVL